MSKRLTKKKLLGYIDLLEADFADYKKEQDRKWRELERNGVATAINRLNGEVFKEAKEEDDPLGFSSSLTRLWGITPRRVPTLLSKVNAIIDHLGIDINIVEKTAKVQATKKAAKKPVTKKTNATKKAKK